MPPGFWNIDLGNLITIGMTLSAVILYFGRYQNKLEDIVKDVSEIKSDLRSAITNGGGLTTDLAVLAERVAVLEREHLRLRDNIYMIANHVHASIPLKN